MRGLIKKTLGSQHPHDRIVEIFKGFDCGGRVLDAPAGTGTISQKLKEAGFDVVAADINPHLFSAQKIPFKEADLNKTLPFEDEMFDFILCSNGIEHLEDPFHFIRECFRLLKGEGKILITTPNVLNLKSRMANLLVGFNLFTGRPYNEVDDYSGGDHIHLAHYYELRINLHRNGFRILEATAHSYSHRAMLFAPLYPIVCLATRRAFRRERNPRQKERNEEIFHHVTSFDLIFGKKLFLLAEKNSSYWMNQ